MTSQITTSYFAILESYAPQLLAGDTRLHRASIMSAGQIGVFGALGQNDAFVETDYAAIRSNIRRALLDPKARTIDLVIDSPGGAVLGLPETAAAIRAANSVKPVRAFVPGIAASAAYWLASQASTITLTPSGQVGSVGVLDIHADITKSLENQGVSLTVVTAGPHKAERASGVIFASLPRNGRLSGEPTPGYRNAVGCFKSRTRATRIADRTGTVKTQEPPRSCRRTPFCPSAI